MDVYLGLLLTAFLSATLLPGASEAAVVALMVQNYDVVMILGVATFGNTLGSVVNYAMGRYFIHFEDKAWFPIKANELHRAQHWFQRYGGWSMLLAWLPVVGDGLTLLAGTMKLNFLLFIVLVAIGKAARYAAILGLLTIYF